MSYRVGAQVRGKIQLLRENYYVVSLLDTEGGHALVMFADYHCPKKSCSSFSIDAEMTLTVVFVPPEVTSAAPSSFPHEHCVICVEHSSNDTHSNIAR